MLLSYKELLPLLYDSTVVGAEVSQVNSASIDIRLGAAILVELPPEPGCSVKVAALRERTPLQMKLVSIETPYRLRPGEFILAYSAEKFNLPPTLSAEYKMKSSMARMGLNHMTASWCDAGWRNSHLTMELQNVTRYHEIEIQAGDFVGQMLFFRHQPVPFDKSYAVRGRYNNDGGVRGIKP